MTSKSSESIPSLKEYKCDHDVADFTKEAYSKTNNLHLPEKQLNQNPKWFKGTRDRGFRGHLVA